MSKRLFELIGSLSRNEKGYFKKFSSKHEKKEGNIYIKLFDAIEGQDNYNEEEIRKKFIGETFLKHLHLTKIYLYNFILKSLETYYGNHSNLRTHLAHIELLYKRGLFEHCRVIIKRTKKILSQSEDYAKLLEIIQWELDIISQGAFRNTSYDKILSLEKERNDVMKLLNNIHKYEHISGHFGNLLGTMMSSPLHQQKIEFRKIISDEFFKDEKNALSYRSKLIYNYVHAKYYLTVVRNYDKAEEYNLNALALFENMPYRIDNKLNLYIAVLTDLLLIYAWKKNEQMFAESEAKLFSIRKKINFESQGRMIMGAHLQKLNLYDRLAHFEKINELIHDINRDYEYYYKTLNSFYQKLLPFSIGYMYYGAGDLKKAVTWLNKIIHHENQDIRQDIISFAYIFQLAIHFDRENFDLFPILLKRAAFIITRSNPYQYETLAYSFFNSMSKGSFSGKELTRALKIFLDKLTVLKNDPHEKSAFDAFDLCIWAESKLLKRSFAQIRSASLRS